MESLGMISINDKLELKASSIDGHATIILKLTRISAQRLSESLLEFAGVSGYMPSGQKSFAATDLTPVPKEFQNQKTVPVLVHGKYYRSRRY